VRGQTTNMSKANRYNKLEELRNQRFLLRKRKRLICFGLILFLLADTNSPAFEKSLSDGTDVLGTHKYFIARCCSWGYCLPFCCHHKRGSSFHPMFFCCKYWRVSTIASEVGVLLDVISATCRSKACHSSFVIACLLCTLR